jgi:hypothetical protein
MGRSRGLHLAVAESPEDLAAADMFEGMLAGWRDQQLSRCLNERTIDARARLVRRFGLHAGAWPWRWVPGHLESWVSELRGERRAHSTIRSYQLAVGAFCDYACDPAYGWAASCLAQFASAPSQVCRAENLATHASEYEGRPARRSLTRDELQALFDAADDDVVERIFVNRATVTGSAGFQQDAGFVLEFTFPDVV